jgi:hypothetical protein
MWVNSRYERKMKDGTSHHTKFHLMDWEGGTRGVLRLAPQSHEGCRYEHLTNKNTTVSMTAPTTPNTFTSVPTSPLPTTNTCDPLLNGGEGLWQQVTIALWTLPQRILAWRKHKLRYSHMSHYQQLGTTKIIVQIWTKRLTHTSLSSQFSSTGEFR